MASLFEQFERESQMMMSGGESSNPFEDEPIFQKVKFDFQPSEFITNMAVCSDYIVMAMSNKILLRIDPYKSPNEQYSEIDLNRIVPGVKLTGIFLDPTATHLLVSFSTELLYVHRKSSKPKPITKLKGHEVTAVGWPSVNIFSDSNSPKPVLVGTSKGQIFEVGISADEGLFQSTGEVYCKQVWNLGQRGTTSTEGLDSITGLEFHSFEKMDTYFVVVTTQDRLYQFVGRIGNPDERPLLPPLFNKYLGLPESFHSLPGFVDYSKLQLYTQSSNSTPSALCWLTEAGIYYGQIELKGSSDSILSKTKMFNFPLTYPTPTSFLMTEFHILFVYQNQICGISSLSEQLVFTDNFNESFGSIVDIIQDPVKGTIWVFQERAFFKYKVVEEDKHVWQIYAEKGDFEEAKRYCKNDSLKRDKVLRLQAESLFKQKEYELAASCFAASQAPFETVALKFLDVKGSQALKTFLKEKLGRLRAEDKAQKTMLVLWNLELLLTELGDLRTNGKINTTQYVQIEKELEALLEMEHTKACLKSNIVAVYSLMSSHGDQSNLLKLAISAKDYEKVVSHYIYSGKYSEALEVLKKISNPDIWYTYLPTLLQEDSKQTLMVLGQVGKAMDITKILPYIIAAYTPNNANDLIKYLEFSTVNCHEEALHNFLIYLLAQHRKDRLLTYLAMQGDEPSMVNYDIRYAVRICKQFNCREACVKLYRLLGLWELAVELALQVSMQLARQTVSHPQIAVRHDPKKLWLKIAQHLIEKENDIPGAMALVGECEYLKIEDVLRFFPDLTTIDHFKDAICSSLQEYNQHIDDMKEEMEDATKSAQIIRNEINAFRSRHCVISTSDLCCICETTLLQASFYVFPCSHKFHTDCLIEELMPLLNVEEAEQLQSLLKREENPVSFTEKERRKAESDVILARQCLFCGDHMVDLINKPFPQLDEHNSDRNDFD